MRRVAVPITILSLLAIVGCTAAADSDPSGSPSSTSTAQPGDAITLTLDDLRGVVAAEDGLTTLDFELTEVQATASDDLESMLGVWDQSSGEPDECRDIFLAPFLVRDDEAEVDDPTMELAAYFEPAPDNLGLVLVNGRIFDGSEEALAFLDDLPSAAETCADGYTLDLGDGRAFTATGFELGGLGAQPDGVGVTAVDTLLGEGESDGQRTVLLQRANAVVSVSGEWYPGGTFAGADLDAVAAAIADRLSQK